MCAPLSVFCHVGYTPAGVASSYFSFIYYDCTNEVIWIIIMSFSTANEHHYLLQISVPPLGANYKDFWLNKSHTVEGLLLHDLAHVSAVILSKHLKSRDSKSKKLHAQLSLKGSFGHHFYVILDVTVVANSSCFILYRQEPRGGMMRCAPAKYTYCRYLIFRMHKRELTFCF